MSEYDQIAKNLIAENERLKAERIAPDHVYERNRELLLEVDAMKARIEKLEAVVDAAKRLMSGWPSYWVRDANAILQALAALEDK